MNYKFATVMLTAGLITAMSPGVRSQQLGQFDPKEAEARFERWRETVPTGSGKWPAHREVAEGLPTHTIYWPSTMPRSKGRMPIIAFANGGCLNTSIEFAAFLAEIASHGYLVVAIGTDDVEYGFMRSGLTKTGKPYQMSKPAALTEAVDWAIKEGSRTGSQFKGRVAIDRVAYMGQSCGGVMALNASADPRTTTTVVLNSGYFRGKAPAAMGMPAPLPWTSFTKPIAFFTGGKTDVAFSNAEANFADAKGIPMFKASLPVGHTGAYPAPDMRWTRAVIAWLDWNLKDDNRASKNFVGKDCVLCMSKEWTDVASHDLP